MKKCFFGRGLAFEMRQLLMPSRKIRKGLIDLFISIMFAERYEDDEIHKIEIAK